ncbi:hypothetical protein [Flavobacterium sp. ZS1P14]|uniref:hypothetical protein n=1 Tax=Flavobacterium sp. ZS1P14 TaxID=3401729 RepID=UPI003AAE919C
MKKLLLLLLFTGFVTGGVQAQEKQRKVLLQQIAALKVYIDYAQKGYSVAKTGLNAIGDLKRGEFNLHADYLSSLKKVSPQIKKYSRVAEIIALQAKIMASYKHSYGHVTQGDLFHGSEVAYIKRVFDRLLEDCTDTLDELIAVTMDGELEMKDDERMQRIDGLYLNMMDNYRFCQRFNNQTKVLYLSRTKENHEVPTSRALHGILND